MKQFNTKNILLEVTEEELKMLDACINSALIRMDELGWEENYIRKVDKLWYQIYEIEKSLPF